MFDTLNATPFCSPYTHPILIQNKEKSHHNYFRAQYYIVVVVKGDLKCRNSCVVLIYIHVTYLARNYFYFYFMLSRTI